MAKRRKPKSARKDSQIRVRVTEHQKQIFIAAAESAGLDVSGWLRNVGLEAAAGTRRRGG
jgi:hypothetical protein